MKKLILFIFILLTCIVSTQGRNTKFEFQIGVGTYNMSDLKDLNEAIPATQLFNTEIVSNFPPYLYWRPSLTFYTGKMAFGFFLNLQSTGSRVSASDYSGEYCFDMRIKGYGPGLNVAYNISEFSGFQVWGNLALGFNYTSMNMKEYFEFLETTYTDEKIKLNAYNGFIEPGIRVDYKLNNIPLHLLKPCSLFINLGFQFQLLGKPLYYQKPENVYQDSWGYTLNPDWSGLRIALGLSVPI